MFEIQSITETESMSLDDIQGDSGGHLPGLVDLDLEVPLSVGLRSGRWQFCRTSWVGGQDGWNIKI